MGAGHPGDKLTAMVVLAGRVICAATGRGINNVRIMIDSAPQEVIDIAALSGGDGNFELDLPVPGDYGVAFVAEGYEPRIVVVPVGEGREWIEVSLQVSVSDD